MTQRQAPRSAARPALSLVMAATLALLGGAAQAQTAPADDKKPDADELQRLDTVTVTSNRRLETAQKVSGVVQSIGGEQLRKDGITELRQLQGAIPGLSIANQEGNAEIYIRGVGSANNTELGDPGAAPHLNGVYIPRPRGLGLMFYDLERVEVNKGPQGTLYGRNALAGTLNIISAQPRLGQFGGYAQADVSNRDGHGVEGAVNLPLGTDAALRIAAYQSKKDYGFTNVSTDAQARQLQPAGLEDNNALRLSARWEPTEALRFSLVADSGRERGTGYPGANIFSAVTASGLRPEDLDLRHVAYRGQQGDMRNDLWGVLGKVEADLGPVSLEFNASRRSVDFWQRNGQADGIAWPGRDLGAIQYDNSSTQYWQTLSKSNVYELLLRSNDDQQPLQWTAGVFHFDEKQAVGYLSLADRGCCYWGTEFTMPDVRGKSTAAYVDATYKVAPQWRALAGFRRTQESKSRYGIGGNVGAVLGGENWDCCYATRWGTDGFQPALLARPNFDMGQVTTDAQKAQFILESILTPGARDVLRQQLLPLANGSNPLGQCVDRPDVNDNGRLSCPTTTPGNTNGGFAYVADLAVPKQQYGSSKARYNDFRIGVEHDLGRDAMVYAKFSTGHKAGGFNDVFETSPIPEVYGPEKLSVLELGSRNVVEVMGRRAVANLSGFFYDYKNQVFQDLTCIQMNTQVTPNTCSGYSLVNRNIGASRLYGLEGELRLPLPAGFSLDVNAVLLQTKIRNAVVADARAIDYGQGGKAPNIDLTGNQLPLASKVNLSARLQQVFALGAGKFDWQALLSYRSAYYLTQYNERDVVTLGGTRTDALAAGFPDRQKGYATLNLGVGYTFDRYRIEAFGSNVTNEQASTKALVGSALNVRFLNDARSYGLRARVNF
ncbi:MAG: TonB-dependent receptor [Roseateles sp.]|uniref:TonB-dependent receptor n=1 Tax=Roseateles sp. TaxID=1971397 RepID=UPI0039E7DDC1